ncbi:hypothetical protein [Allonocardiopsis opalescens]|uniref:Uncharacterized protein n=1 Tax=Allonocardiopsis opalescens TaxID=1144618 RepID=A0A2T0Q305_9ACTN|nr:hypothetical protein [Allonocardiopsis opalescens]PRX98175.1 hypothetical protein CLV72_105529 [Allonocardiopsis opalescens]
MEADVSRAPAVPPHLRLREEWRGLSRAGGWTMADDWWSPAVDAVTSAAVRGEPLDAVCERLGRCRARAGVGLGAALDDLGALCAALGWGEPPLRLVKMVAEGWVECGLSGALGADCHDPLTGLANAAYLRTRLRELYRGAGSAEAAVSSRRLVLVDAGGHRDPWRRIAWAIVIGHELRRVFTGGETLCMLDARLAVGLVESSGGLGARIAELRRVMAREHRARVWTRPLPATWQSAARLLDKLMERP